MTSSNDPLPPTHLNAKALSMEEAKTSIPDNQDFPSIAGPEPSPPSRKVALGAWGSVNHLVGHQSRSKGTSGLLTPSSTSCSSEAASTPDTTVKPAAERESVRGGSIDLDPSEKSQSEQPQNPGAAGTGAATEEWALIRVPPSSAQVKTAAVLQAVRGDGLAVLGNFCRNYTSGLTRLDAGAKFQVSARNFAYAQNMARCEPVIFGGCAYAMLQNAVRSDTTEEPFRPTTDIDIRVPFPTKASRKKKGWHQFTHASATRAFEVAQDRVIEMVRA